MDQADREREHRRRYRSPTTSAERSRRSRTGRYVPTTNIKCANPNRRGAARSGPNRPAATTRASGPKSMEAMLRASGVFDHEGTHPLRNGPRCGRPRRDHRHPSDRAFQPHLGGPLDRRPISSSLPQRSPRSRSRAERPARLVGPGVLSVATSAAFILSRTIDLHETRDGTAHSSNPLGLGDVTAEATVVIIAVHRLVCDGWSMLAKRDVPRDDRGRSRSCLQHPAGTVNPLSAKIRVVRSHRSAPKC